MNGVLMENKKDRSRYLDVVKGITIMLVVLGHCVQCCPGTGWEVEGKFFTNPLFKVIYSFHMPAFMAVNGYLLYFQVRKYEIAELIKRKLITMCIPLLVWTQIAVAKSLIEGFRVESIRELIGFEYESILGIWYLVAILGCTFFMVICEKMPSVPLKTVYLAVLIAAFFVTPDSADLKYVKFLFPMMLAGYMFNKYEFGKRIAGNKRILPVAAVISASVWGVCFAFFESKTYIYNTGFTLLGKSNKLMQIHNDVLRCMIGLSGTVLFLILVYFLFKISEKLRVWKVIAEVGTKSLGIYLLNGYVISYFAEYAIQKLDFHPPAVVLWLISAAAVISIGWFISWLLSKTSVTAFVFFGQYKKKPESKLEKIK